MVMFLKRLDIVGFKSFADSVKLDFEPGITVVVGPNGCGKSNIIDAIRWCLGEMSAKSLRSNMMLDVVFNGSGSRPPQNMAEVTLTFDNTDKRLPIDFSEVSITRRIFRSGESEYYINKTQCRLKDIRDLFLDTGMGEDGYSSMEQGKVEWILQAKPEERRELFEEAAGVSKYRARREEALRKLDRVELDLSRINDIIAVTQDQIKKLENAVSRAKTYERLKQELRAMEVADWLAQLDQHRTELTRIKSQLESSQQKIEELNTLAHQQNAGISTLRLELTEVEEKLIEANSLVSAVDADIKIGEERLANAKQRELDLHKQKNVLQATIEREEVRKVELAVQKDAQFKLLGEIKSEESGIEAEYVTSQETYNFALQHLDNKKKEIKELRDLILAKARERAHLHQQMGNLASDVTRFESQISNLEKEREKILSQMTETKQAFEGAVEQRRSLEKQMNDFSSSLSGLDTQMKALEERETESQKRLLQKAEEIARLNGQIHSLRDQQSHDPYLAGLNAIVGLPNHRIYGPLGRLIECAPQDRDLVAATLGEHLGDAVAETVEDAERAIEYLREAQKGRARIWILDRIPARPDTQPIGQMSVGDKLLNRLQTGDRFKPLLSYLCSSLWVQGSTIYDQAMINGGTDPALWKSHMPHRLPELEKSLARLESERTALESQIRSFEEKMKAIKEKREAAIKDKENARIRMELLSEEFEKIKKKRDLLQEESQVVEIELAQIKDDKVKVQYALEQAQERFQLFQNQEKDDHDQLDLFQQELTELQLSHAKAQGNLSNKLERRQAFLEKFNWQKSVLDRVEHELSLIDSNLTLNRTQHGEIDKEIQSAQSNQKEAAALIKESLEKRRESAVLSEALQAQRVKNLDRIKLQEEQLRNLHSDLGLLQNTLQDDKIREATLTNKIDILVQKLFEQYELSEELARNETQSRLADPETLDRLKKRVANMGAINMAAPQEHAELLEKNNFLVTQQTDLVKAKEDLKQVITKINTTTREHFKETFELVRENFRTLYSQLFRGGEADLRFTNEADLLSTGIDIYCQPPGKKLLHISLLSGGEKALTAAALLFSFFQVRPSPVALLDEVDAALDEANVVRFVDMIKKFSEKSQFFLISHNKRSMEAANSLYGVTMEELGVSKVISARLQKEKDPSPTPSPTEKAQALA